MRGLTPVLNSEKQGPDIGERNNTIWEFREYAMIPNVLFLRPDVGLAGGITNIKKIAAVAESFHQRIIPHNFLGPISNLITLNFHGDLLIIGRPEE